MRYIHQQQVFAVVVIIMMTITLCACGSPLGSEGAPLLIGSLQDVRGRIVFEAKGTIEAINADGSGRIQLATHGGWPSWSPDGTHIVFAGGNTEESNIYVMQENGAGVIQLTMNGGTAPVWSP